MISLLLAGVGGGAETGNNIDINVKVLFPG